MEKAKVEKISQDRPREYEVLAEIESIIQEVKESDDISAFVIMHFLSIYRLKLVLPAGQHPISFSRTLEHFP